MAKYNSPIKKVTVRCEGGINHFFTVERQDGSVQRYSSIDGEAIRLDATDEKVGPVASDYLWRLVEELPTRDIEEDVLVIAEFSGDGKLLDAKVSKPEEDEPEAGPALPVPSSASIARLVDASKYDVDALADDLPERIASMSRGGYADRFGLVVAPGKAVDLFSGAAKSFKVAWHNPAPGQGLSIDASEVPDGSLVAWGGKVAKRDEWAKLDVEVHAVTSKSYRI